MRGRGELVLLLAADLPLQRGQRGVLAHRQPGARLAVLRDRRARCRRAGSAPARSAAPAVSRAALTFISFLRSLSLIATGASEVVSVPPAMPTSIWPRAILLATWIVGLEAGAAGLLDVGRRRLGRELRAQHRLAGQVEVARVLEHRAGDDLAEPLALEPEPGDQPVDGRGEHVLVGRVGVDAVGAGERDAVAAEDGDATGMLAVMLSILVEQRRIAPMAVRGRSRNVDSELHRRVTTVDHERPLPGLRVQSPIGKLLVKNLGLPDPVPLERYAAGDAARRRHRRSRAAAAGWPSRCPGCSTRSASRHAQPPTPTTRYRGLVFDATGLTDSSRARCAARLLRPADAQPGALPAARRHRHAARRRSTGPSGSPSARSRASPAASARRSAAAAPPSWSTSPRARRARCCRPWRSCCRRSRRTSPARWSASAPPRTTPTPARSPTGCARSTGKVALVTGASRGIGEQIARVLHRDGATVIGVDVPQAADDLVRLTNELEGDYLALDITAKDAPAAHRPPPRGDRARRRRRRRAQRRHHPRQEARQHGRGPLGVGDRRQPHRTRADHPRAARPEGDQRQRPHRRRRLDRRHRRQPRPDQLRHLQGRRHRPGRLPARTTWPTASR